MGLGATALGAVGSSIAGARASRMADETRKAFGIHDIFDNEINPRNQRATHLGGLFFFKTLRIKNPYRGSH